jgi:hypothetical protein
MARNDWVYLNFSKPLMKAVDKAVKSAHSYGSPKYADRRDFATKAIQKLLDEELQTKELEATA